MGMVLSLCGCITVTCGPKDLDVVSVSATVYDDEGLAGCDSLCAETSVLRTVLS